MGQVTNCLDKTKFRNKQFFCFRLSPHRSSTGMRRQRPKSMLTGSPRFLPQPLVDDSTRSPTHSPRSRSGSIDLSMRLAALSSEVDTSRSIGGRLGGRFNSNHSLKSLERALSISRINVIDVPTEVSKLLPPSPGLSIASTVLDPVATSTWIFPALCCASAYAFYNVSEKYDLI